jgi:hypothetical protein
MNTYNMSYQEAMSFPFVLLEDAFRIHREYEDHNLRSLRLYTLASDERLKEIIHERRMSSDQKYKTKYEESMDRVFNPELLDEKAKIIIEMKRRGIF